MSMKSGIGYVANTSIHCIYQRTVCIARTSIMIPCVVLEVVAVLEPRLWGLEQFERKSDAAGLRDETDMRGREGGRRRGDM